MSGLFFFFLISVCVPVHYFSYKFTDTTRVQITFDSLLLSLPHIYAANIKKEIKTNKRSRFLLEFACTASMHKFK